MNRTEQPLCNIAPNGLTFAAAGLCFLEKKLHLGLAPQWHKCVRYATQEQHTSTRPQRQTGDQPHSGAYLGRSPRSPRTALKGTLGTSKVAGIMCPIHPHAGHQGCLCFIAIFTSFSTSRTPNGEGVMRHLHGRCYVALLLYVTTLGTSHMAGVLYSIFRHGLCSHRGFALPFWDNHDWQGSCTQYAQKRGFAHLTK